VIANTVKHAAAATILIHVENQINHFKLTIKDDGNGFDIANTKKGAGLRNIHDRALILGATLDIQSTIGKGTIIQLDLEK